MKTREEVLDLMNSWVKSESLRGHCLSVGASMEAYARKFGLSNGEIEKWWACGILHDFDWERYPDIDLHPIEGCKELGKRGYDGEIIEAILGHNSKTGIPRKGRMAKTLFAVDELSGLVVALSKVRPGGFEGMTAKSVKKVMKKKDFASAINREDIILGVEELGMDMDEHFELVIKAQKEV